MKTLEPGQLYSANSADIPWKPSTWFAGLSVKDIAVTGGLEMQIIRLEAGVQLPVHTHELPEFIYVLEGELMVGDQRLSSGWVSVASAGSVHSGVRSDTGCVFMLVDRPV